MDKSQVRWKVTTVEEVSCQDVSVTARLSILTYLNLFLYNHFLTISYPENHRKPGDWCHLSHLGTRTTSKQLGLQKHDSLIPPNCQDLERFANTSKGGVYNNISQLKELVCCKTQRANSKLFLFFCKKLALSEPWKVKVSTIDTCLSVRQGQSQLWLHSFLKNLEVAHRTKMMESFGDWTLNSTQEMLRGCWRRLIRCWRALTGDTAAFPLPSLMFAAAVFVLAVW